MRPRVARPAPAARTRLSDIDGVTASISEGGNRAGGGLAIEWQSTRAVSAAPVTTSSLMRSLECVCPVDQSARDRAGFYLSVVCGGDFSDVAHLNAEFAAELWNQSARCYANAFGVMKRWMASLAWS